MIERHESCIGFSFPSIGRWKIELWFVPKNYTIKPHTHPNQDIKLVFLFGHNIRFHRRKPKELFGESFYATYRNIGRIFTINRNDEHSFDVSNWPLIFMNIEKWYDVLPTSAAKDFQPID